MDAPVHLRGVDPAGANAVQLGIARRGNGRDVRECAESALQIREVRGRRAGSARSYLLKFCKPMGAQNGAST
jgi:hypothetical protein